MRAWSRVAVAVLVLVPATACQAGREESPSRPAASQQVAPPPGMDESLREAALALVEERERALRSQDREAFLATVDPGAGDFAATQARWFDNLAELPVVELSLELGDESVMTRVHGEGGLQLPVDFTMRLDGYDARPATQPLIYTFEGDEDEVRLTSDRNIQSDAMTRWVPAPWDVTDISVAEADGVLGVFDDETRGAADRVMTEIAAARDDITPLLPSWSGKVVAYDISDVGAIDKMSALELDDTAGVAFPVLADPRRERVAGYRFAVNPAHTEDGLGRRLLFRHELVHVALGADDDDSPTWLTEGAAEYVAQAAEWDAPRRRRILAAMVGAGPAEPLTTGRDFYQQDPARNYALAALACSYLVDTRGPDVLWRLMATFRGAEAYSPGDVEDVVRAELGSSTEEIVAAALAWARTT